MIQDVTENLCHIAFSVFGFRKTRALNLTQKSFASILGVSSRTVEAWEAGKSNPSPTARNLIYLISQDHSLIQKLLTIYE